MNKQELKELIEVRNNELQDVNYWASDYHKGHDRATQFFLHLLDQLDEPEITEKQAWELIGGYNGMTAKEANQMFADGMVNRKSDKSIKRDDVLDRLQEIGEQNRNEWIEVILRVFDNDYGTTKYREGYEQGVLNGILTSNKNKLVEIPQFVADWYEKNKDDLEDNIDALIRNSRDGVIRRPIETWMLDKSNRPIETLIRMKEGYTIETPKTLQVIVKNYDCTIYKTELPEDEAMKLIEGWK